MKTRCRALCLVAAVSLAMLTGLSASHAQNRHLLTFKGTVSTLDESGNEVIRPLTDKNLVQEWAGRSGVTNFKNLALAFHPNADSRGDAIEVVNRKDGSYVTTVLPLLFPERASVMTSKGVIEKRFAYVYNLHQSEFSRGTAVMNEQILVNKRGATNRFVVNGEIQWYQLPEGTNRLRICSGTFKVGKPIK